MIILDKRTLIAKIETTSGTYDAPASADFDVLVRDIKMSNEIEMYGRKYAIGAHDHAPSVAGKQSGTIDFVFELQYGGTPQTPLKATKFLQGMGLVETVNGSSGVRWMPNVANDAKSLSFVIQDIQQGGSTFLKYTFKGMMASSAKIVMAKLSEPLRVECQFKGCFVSINDVAIGSVLSITSPDSAQPDSTLSATITRGGTAQKIGKFELDLGLTTSLLLDPADATGYKQAFISKRAPKLTWDKETQLLAVDADYTQHLAGTTGALVISTSNFSITAPVLQLQTNADGDRDGAAVSDQTYILCNSVAGGNDSLKINQKTGG